MSETAASPLQVPSTSNEPHSKPHSHSTEPPLLHLRIRTSCVGLYHQPPENITSDTDVERLMTTGPPNPSFPDDKTCLLRGPLADFLLFSRQEKSKWLIDIAHDICDPKQKRGKLRVWDEAAQTWKDVDPTDPLTASDYLYDVQDVISLTKISHRENKFKTSVTGNASTMGNRVKRRDRQRCWVTRNEVTITNSHVCPKRMGDHLVRDIYRTFESTPLPPGFSIFHEMCGITLSLHLDYYFDKYEFGLRLVKPDKYECHAFLPPDWREGLKLTIWGTGLNASQPLLHGYEAISPKPQHPCNPSPGLLRWHYLQCVIRKFAHDDYKKLQNIQYYELPLRMEGDSDDEGTDNEYASEWPSAILDRGQAMQMDIAEHEERQRLTAEWAATLSRSLCL